MMFFSGDGTRETMVSLFFWDFLLLGLLIWFDRAAAVCVAHAWPVKRDPHQRRNLEIPLVALAELDLDLHLALRFSDHYGNVPRTTYNNSQ